MTNKSKSLAVAQGACLLCVLLLVPQAPAGDFSVGGGFTKKSLKEGAAGKDFFQVAAGKPFEMEIYGPQSLVLLVRSERAGKIELTFTLDEKQEAKKSIEAKPTVSKGIFISVAKGKHRLVVTGSVAALFLPVSVKRNRSMAGEETLAFKGIEKLQVKPTESLAQASSAAQLLEEAEQAEQLPPPPEPALVAAEESAPPFPPAPLSSPVKVESAAPPAPKEKPFPIEEKPQESFTTQFAAPGQPAPAVVEEKLVGERRLEPEPPPEPAGIGYFGQRGFFRSWASLPYSRFSVALGTSAEYFQATDYLREGDKNERVLGKLTVAGVPYPGLEISAGFGLSANSNNAFQPRESQSIGDPFLSVRYGHKFLDWFAVGGGVQTVMPTGKRFSQLSVDGLSTRILFTFDFMPLAQALITLNAGYHFDNSKRIFDYPLTEAQRFAAGINPHDQVLFGLGFGWRVGPVSPFLEYGAAFAVGSDVDVGFADQPSWLTLGLRYYPLRFATLQIMLAADIGLTGVHPPEGYGRIPPYNIVLAMGYDFGAAPPPAVVEKRIVRVEKVETAPATPRFATAGGSRVVGKVLDAESGKPIGGARVIMGGDEPAIFLSDPEEGRFYTCPMTPGPVKLSVYREGYREESQVVLVTEKPETPVTIRMQASSAAAFGSIKGTVRAVTGLPLPALISIPARNINLRANRADGAFETRVETGSFDVLISLPGYATQRRKVKLEAGDVIIINVELYPKK